MKQMDFGTIAVVMGGPSAERDISLKSGHTVLEALTARGHRAVPVIFAREDTTMEAVAGKLRAAQCDVVFNALHGTFGEDGAFQQLLDALQIPYTGSGVEASRLAFDKWATRQRLIAVDIAVPQAVRLTAVDIMHIMKDERPFHRQAFPGPVVVKPIRQGSSFGVSIIDAPYALAEAVRQASAYDHEVLLERCIVGRELTVAVFDEQALPIIEIRPRRATFFDVHAKYDAGATEYLVPAALDELVTLRVQQAALAAHRAIGCRHFSRVDMVFGADHTVYVLELNTIPGLTSTSLLPMAAQACGCDFGTLCAHMVSMAVEHHEAAVLLK